MVVFEKSLGLENQSTATVYNNIALNYKECKVAFLKLWSGIRKVMQYVGVY